MRGLTIYILFFFFFIGGSGMIYFLNRISAPAPGNGEEVQFTIESGEGVNQISANLKNAGLIVDPFTFEVYLWIRRLESKIQAGEYLLPNNVSAMKLASRITQGEGVSNEQVVQILEGWTIDEIAAYVDEKGVVKESDFLATARVTDSRTILPNEQYDFLASKPATVDLEGYLFPDTYRIFKGSDSPEIVKRMLDNFGKKLTASMRDEIRASGRTIHEVVTLASIVEKEVQSEEDMSTVAGIFLNRLEIGKPLESDATVNYITRKGTTRPSLDDLQVESPYNTYKNTGLPPGPIANPSIQAIEAVINPTDSSNLFFLTTPEGRVIYSKTFEEHLANKRRYYP